MKQQILSLAFLLTLVCSLLPMPAVSAGDPQQAQLLPGVQVIQSDSVGVVLELTTPSFTLVDDEGVEGACRRVEVSGYPQMGSDGAPMLAVRPALFGAPSLGELHLSVTPLESQIAATAFRPCPGPKTILELIDGEPTQTSEQPTAGDEAIYNTSVFYPEQAAQLEELGFLRSQRIARIVFHPFQVNPVTGELIHHRRLRVEVRFDAPANEVSAAAVESPAFEQTLADLLVNYPSTQSMRTASVQAAAVEAWRPPLNAFRVVTEKEGVYELTYATLAAAGVPVDTIEPDKFRLYYDGAEVAINVTGAADNSFDPGDALLFYALAIDDRYTRFNTYWLSYGATPGLRMALQSGAGGGVGVGDYAATVRVEDNLSYVSSLPLESGYDHWYGPRLTAVGVDAVARRDAPVPTTNLAAGLHTARLTLAVAGNVYGEHHLRIYVNGSQVADHTWSGRKYAKIVAEFDQSLLTSPSSTVRLELLNDSPNQSVSMIYIDWLTLEFQRSLVAENDRISFVGANVGANSYSVSGFSVDQVEIYDVTEPARAASITASGAGGAVTFAANQAGPRRYTVQSVTQRQAPVRVEKVTPSNLVAPTVGADLIIITHRDFLADVQPLAQFRAEQGVRVRVVDVQEIYDQFNFGRRSALAIRDFLKHAYLAWPAPAPAYVLLVGDGHYDLRGYLSTSGPVFIPPFLVNVDPDLGETAADNRFVTIAGDDLLPDMHIGRLPAESSGDVKAMVNKIFAYAGAQTADGWNQNLLFVTDNLQGGGGSFYNFSDAIFSGTVQSAAGEAPLVPVDYNRTRLYMGRDCPSESPSLVCQQQILEAMNQGTLLVSYVGHGAKQYWAEEKLLTLTALQKLNNGDRLPVMLPMTCLEGYFHEADPSQSVFGESIVRMPVVGAVASWSPTGFGLVTGHDYLERGFFLALFHAGLKELGPATSFGKLYLLQNAVPGKYDDLVDTFGLLGDPMLQMRVTGSQPVLRTHSSFLPVVTR